MQLLAGIVAAGLQPGTSDAQVDRAHLLLTLVQNLEAVHIRTLMVIGLPRQGAGQVATQCVTGGVANDELLARLRELESVLDPVLATLVAQGLIADQLAGATVQPDGSTWGPTDFGRFLLEHLDPAGGNTNP